MSTQAVVLTPASPEYPQSLLGGGAFSRLWALGSLEALARPLLGLFCTTRCPGDVILRAYATARSLRDARVAVIGGFHTPMEQECLELLLRGAQPVVWCPARPLPRPRRLPAPRRAALEEGRLLILSPFDGQRQRMTAERAEVRNQLVVQLSHRLLFLYAPPGTRTEALCRAAIASGKPVFGLAGERCANLLRRGALPAGEEDLPDLLRAEVRS
jgi:hypothetical protein